MKKIVWFGMVLLLAIVLMVGCGSNNTSQSTDSQNNADNQNNENSENNENPQQSEVKPIELTFSSYAPPLHDQHVNVVEPFLKEIEALTDGRVSGTLYPGSALGAADVQLDLVLSGSADMALGAHGYNQGRFPLTSISELPFMGASAEEGSWLLWKLLETFPEYVDEHEGAKVGWLFKNDGYNFFTSEKPIRSIDDIKGLRMRTPNAAGSKILEALGAIPVSMPMPDVYEAMQRGVIDGAFVPASVVVNYNMGDVTSYITRGDFMSISQYVVINQGTWDSISAEDQAVIEELIGEEMSMKAGRVYDADAEAGWAAAEEAGVEIYVLSDEEIDEWMAILNPIIDAWIDEMDGKGYPAREIYDTARELLEGRR